MTQFPLSSWSWLAFFLDPITTSYFLYAPVAIITLPLIVHLTLPICRPHGPCAFGISIVRLSKLYVIAKFFPTNSSTSWTIISAHYFSPLSSVSWLEVSPFSLIDYKNNVDLFTFNCYTAKQKYSWAVPTFATLLFDDCWSDEYNGLMRSAAWFPK